MTVHGYIFLAPFREERVGLAEQQRKLTDFADLQGFGLEELVIEEDIPFSVPLGQRPEGRRLLAGLAPGDRILTLRAEWVLASAADGVAVLSELRKKGVALYCVDLDENIATPGQRKLVVSEGGAVLVQKLLAALAVCERYRHGETIRAAKQILKKQGKYLGGPVPFGWRLTADGYLAEEPEQQEVIAEIRQLREDRWSYRDIAVKLRENRGLSFSHEGIRRLLQNDQRRKQGEPPTA